MCRWLVYKGDEASLADILLRPERSLYTLSSAPTANLPKMKWASTTASKTRNRRFSLLTVVKNMFRNHVINEDGYGIGWYDADPGVSGGRLSVFSPHALSNTLRRFSLRPVSPDLETIKEGDEDPKNKIRRIPSPRSLTKPSTRPPPKKEVYLRTHHSLKVPKHDAELNLITVTHRSKLIFAHVRAGTPNQKGDVEIRTPNCHPFKCGQLMWMHNGCINHFADIKKQMIAAVKPCWQGVVQGTTDSELAFAVYLSFLPVTSAKELHKVDVELLVSAMKATIDLIEKLSAPGRASSLNFAVTNGKVVVATRFRNSDFEQPPSLYYAIDNNNVFICSEPYGSAKDEEKYILVPRNHLLILTRGNSVVFEPLLRRAIRQPLAQWVSRARVRLGNEVPSVSPLFSSEVHESILGRTCPHEGKRLSGSSDSITNLVTSCAGCGPLATPPPDLAAANGHSHAHHTHGRSPSPLSDSMLAPSSQSAAGGAGRGGSPDKLGKVETQTSCLAASELECSPAKSIAASWDPTASCEGGDDLIHHPVPVDCVQPAAIEIEVANT
eukprot:Rmarinus@m.4477